MNGKVWLTVSEWALHDVIETPESYLLKANIFGKTNFGKTTPNFSIFT